LNAHIGTSYQKLYCSSCD